METIELNVAARSGQKKAHLANLRRDGGFPAVIYAEGKDSTALELDLHHFSCQTAGKPATQIYTLKSEISELNGKMALIKSMQKEPLKQRIQHVDFYMVTAGTKISVTVPLRLIGECAVVKMGEAILNQTAYEVEVECLPKEIPEFFEIDISALEEGQSINLGELKLPENVVLKSDTKLSVVSALAKKAEVEEVPEEEVPAEGEAAAATDGAPAAGGDAKPGDAKPAADDKGKDKAKG